MGSIESLKGISILNKDSYPNIKMMDTVNRTMRSTDKSSISGMHMKTNIFGNTKSSNMHVE